jgi:capsular exopolysaccharide synthesis family protein
VDLGTVLRILRERWVIVAVTTALAALVGAGITLRQTPMYSARVTLFVSTWGGGSDATAAYQGSLLSQQRVKSYTQLLRGERVMRAVNDELHLNLTPAQLASRIAAEVVPETVMLAVTAIDPSPGGARDIANSVARNFSTLVLEFESLPDGKQLPVRVTLVTPAGLPHSPVSPRPVRNEALAILVGLMVGGALASARHALDTSVKAVDQLTEITGAPSLGTIPSDSNAPKTPLVINDSPYTLRAEAFRKIRTSMQFVDLDRTTKVVLVTSAMSGEGKSTTACNLAVTVAESGKKVLLVEGDLRRPRAARYLGLPGGVGLTSVLLGDVNVAVATQPWGELLSVLASGPLPPNPSELLGSPQMRQLLAHLRQQYDLVVVDGPPVLPVADAAAMANACDGTILVVRHGLTKREQVSDMTKSLRTVDTHILGTVLNMVPARRGGQYYYQEYGPATGLTAARGPRHDPRPETQSMPHRTAEASR